MQTSTTYNAMSMLLAGCSYRGAGMWILMQEWSHWIMKEGKAGMPVVPCLGDCDIFAFRLDFLARRDYWNRSFSGMRIVGYDIACFGVHVTFTLYWKFKTSMYVLPTQAIAVGDVEMVQAKLSHFVLWVTTKGLALEKCSIDAVFFLP